MSHPRPRSGALRSQRAPGLWGALRKRPLTSTKQLMELSGLSYPTASKVIETLVELGIALEITGGRRNRLLAFDAYLAVLSEDTKSL